jgi:CdiI N-terminal domain
MCRFSIEFLSEKYKEDKPAGQLGRITIGNFSEKFVSSLSDWNIETYTKHWIKSSARILYESDSTLYITNIVINSSTDYHLDWWVAYKIGEMAFIQNQLIIPDTYAIANGFNSNNLYTYVRDREIYSDDGDKISEWVVPLKLIEEYYFSGIKTMGLEN